MCNNLVRISLVVIQIHFVFTEPLENWEDAEDNRSLKAKKKSEDEEDQLCSTVRTSCY